MQLSTALILTLAFVLVLSVGLNIFLGTEMMKKFVFNRDFFSSASELTTSVYWAGTKQEQFNKPVMGVIVLSSRKPFGAKIGFRLIIPIMRSLGLGDWVNTIDDYGFAHSREVAGPEPHQIAIATWLSKGAVDFTFLCTEEGVTARIFQGTEEFWRQSGSAIDARFPPHLYQRLGFYA